MEHPKVELDETEESEETRPLMQQETGSEQRQFAELENKRVASRNPFIRWLLPRCMYYIPFLDWLSSYKLKEYLPGDIAAGISVGIMLVPQGLAYSYLARVPPIHGLYTAFFPVLIYAMFGNSRQLSIGPEAMIAILVGSETAEIFHLAGPANLGCDQTCIVHILSFLVGITTLVLGLLRFGFLDNILSLPVLRGALLIFFAIIIVTY